MSSESQPRVSDENAVRLSLEQRRPYYAAGCESVDLALDLLDTRAEIAQLREQLKQEREDIRSVEANYESALEQLVAAEAKIARVNKLVTAEPRLYHRDEIREALDDTETP